MRQQLLRLLLALWVLTSGLAAQPLARVKVPLASVTAAADPASEQVTQVFLWEPVEVVEVKGAWANVLVQDQYRTEKGYPGWIPLSALELEPIAAGGTQVAVAYPSIVLRQSPDTSAPVLSRAFMSTRLPLVAPAKTVKGESWYSVRLPDGRVAWVRASQVQKEVELPLERAQEIVAQARQFEKTPYLWGGMSQQGIDCSGLTYVAYRLNGVTIPRDADQQFQVGQQVARQDLLPGDLVFFGKPDIVHVGIYIGQGNFVHAGGDAVQVSPVFEGWCKENYAGARRLLRDGRAGGQRVLTPTP